MSLVDTLVRTRFGAALARAAYGLSKRSVGAHIARERYRLELLRDPRYADPKRLHRHEARWFSQNGEDGILREIFRRVGTTNRAFVELGVGDGLENNTAALLADGWRGVWVDGDARCCRLIRERFARELESKQLALIEACVDAEKVDSMLAASTADRAPDLLSIDLDRNTFHIWSAIESIRPRVVVIEYNASVPPDQQWTVDYDGAKWWNGTSYFGASLKAIEQRARDRGYALVGCDVTGVNAFLVRAELCEDRFCAPFTAENHYEPHRYFLQFNGGHPRAFRD